MVAAEKDGEFGAILQPRSSTLDFAILQKCESAGIELRNAAFERGLRLVKALLRFDGDMFDLNPCVASQGISASATCSFVVQSKTGS